VAGQFDFNIRFIPIVVEFCLFADLLFISCILHYGQEAFFDIPCHDASSLPTTQPVATTIIAVSTVICNTRESASMQSYTNVKNVVMKTIH
jgi:hypothetical protein